MYTLIAIFYASLLCMLIMLLLKRAEVKSGRRNIVSRLGRGTDHVFGAVFSTIGRWISYVNRKTFIVIAQWIAFHVLLRIRKVYVEVKSAALANPHSKKVIDAVRGRADVKRHGASFYLRRISDK